MNRLSRHFDALCAFEASVAEVASGLGQFLERFGPTSSTSLYGFDESIRWLLPLASFPSRYLLLPSGAWTVLVQNGRSTAPEDLLTVSSKATGTRGVLGSWSNLGRMWHVADAGRLVRAVACYPDGGQWTFHQQGTELPEEQTTSYSRRLKKDRLGPEDVQENLRSLMGVEVPPPWRALMSRHVVGIERSKHEVDVDIEHYEVDVDL